MASPFCPSGPRNRVPAATRTCPECHTPLPVEARFCLNCGTPTPTEPGVPERTAPTGAFEVSRVRQALADRYRIERILGEGGMATVYLAEDLKHKRQVAVKVMRPELAETLGTERFLREVEIAAQLSHPNILPVFDSGSTGGFLWYVMPYVEGEALPARIRRETQLPLVESVRLAREVAEALDYAHGRGIIHRDIKPANILISHGHALVADFGIARAISAEGEAITKTGLAVGTPQYMSPEQASGGRNVDGRADIYALGSVLYEMIAGEPPFTGPTMQVVLARSLTEKPRPLSATRDGIPAQLAQTVARALAKSPADRFETAGGMAAMLADIEHLLRGGSAAFPTTAPVAPASPSKAWLIFGVGALLALTALVLMAVRKGLPPWVLGLAVVLIGGGALALTWTAAAERRRANGAPPRRFDHWLTWRSAALGGVGALAIWALTATAMAVGGPVAGITTGNRLAVLAFTNEGTPGDSNLADGISDEVRGKLTQLPELAVIASTSSDQYRETTKDPQQIARELGASYLLMGKVRWASGANGRERIQVVPELVDGKTGAVKWQQNFDADVADVFAVQSSIATQVATALGAVLGSSERQTLAKQPTSDTAAYELFLKGRAIHGNSASDARRAAGFYEQAVALDSTFVEAWTALTGSLAIEYSNGTRDPAVARRAKQAAERALQLSPNGAPGHRAMALYNENVEANAADAYREVQLALRASPNDPQILASSARLLRGMGRLDEGLTVAERARDLDPRSPTTLAILQGIHISLHQGAEARQLVPQLQLLDPANLGIVLNNVQAYLVDGDLSGARTVVQAALDTVPEPDLVAYFAGYNEMSWVLTDDQRQLLFRLSPASFDNDRAWWGQSLAIAAWDHGDHVRARAYADSSLATSAAQLANNPADPELRVLYGVMLAYLGRKADATRQADSVLAQIGTAADYQNAYYIEAAARVLLAVGDNDRALDLIARLVHTSYYITPAWLRIDPLYTPLKGNTRFEKLVTAGS
jgi:eukaryotic-like serine/threonine-protein kinase